MHENRELYEYDCGFCGERKHRQKGFVTGDDGFKICQDCIDMCDEELVRMGYRLRDVSREIFHRNYKLQRELFRAREEIDQLKLTIERSEYGEWKRKENVKKQTPPTNRLLSFIKKIYFRR